MENHKVISSRCLQALSRQARRFLFVPLLLVACQRDEVFMHYEAVDCQSWDAEETLGCDIPPLDESGNYALRLHVRLTTAPIYPFKTLYVEVAQRWADQQHVDTVACELEAGQEHATGIALRQYAFEVGQYYLQKGDSASVTIHHVMRKQEIEGISDVGISLVKLDHRHD